MLWSSVHPRARGEQVIHHVQRRSASGSSPRTRGTGDALFEVRASDRFIPAHAGNRCSQAWKPLPHAVHPRARGEQVSAVRLRISSSGSSPRTRGTDKHDHSPYHADRFIPAHAGNRIDSGAALEGRPVHPRARGEQAMTTAPYSISRGSSPRTRGTDSQAPQYRVLVRFIPAHAGNRELHTRARPCSPVHPRARGEQQRIAAAGNSTNGSSPRTRGTGSSRYGPGR